MRVQINKIFFVAATLGTLGASPAGAVQEPPFARPAHDEVIPLATKAIPHGAFTVLPGLERRPVAELGSPGSAPLAMPASIDARVAAPARLPVTPRDPVTLELVVRKPLGCFRTITETKTVDERRHLVTVSLIGATDEPCVAARNEEKVAVELGRLAPGEHQVLVGDGVRTLVNLDLSVVAATVPLAE